MKRTFAVFALLLSVLSCTQKGKNAGSTAVGADFPSISVPSLITSEEEQKNYMLNHCWDAFFAGKGQSDSLQILGVKRSEVMETAGYYIMLLHTLPVPEAQKHIKSIFSNIEKVQQRDTSSTFYLQITEIFGKYLYDPNSPFRSEDLYLPLVEGLVNSPFTAPDKLAGYRFELEKCLLNPYGAKVPDFRFKDISGNIRNLYGVNARYTLLFFSNPGCEACKEIIDQLGTRSYLDSMIADGEVAVVNIYIDEEVDKWKEYEHNYPRNWVCGYDWKGLIRQDDLYFVRAIPSLYLLDSQKRVIYKDAPVEFVLMRLDQIREGMELK